MKTILVTGAAGYIGRHVVDALINKGVSVIAFDRNGLNRSDVQSFAVDLFDRGFKIENYLEIVPDACVHLAWRNGFQHNSDSHMLDLSDHYRFLSSLVDFGVPQIAVMGSMHEIGYWEGSIDESTPCNPQSKYGLAKDCLRRALLLDSKIKGYCLQWLRGYYIYGDDENSQSIFGKLIRADKEGKATFPFTSGTNQYDFTQVDVLAEMIACAVLQQDINGIINCCTGIPVSLGEEIESFIDHNHLSIKLEYGAYPDRPYDSPGVWGDATKINAIMANAKVE